MISKKVIPVSVRDLKPGDLIFYNFDFQKVRRVEPNNECPTVNGYNMAQIILENWANPSMEPRISIRYVDIVLKLVVEIV